MEEEKRSLEEQLLILRTSQQATESKIRGLHVRFLVWSLCEVVVFFPVCFGHLDFSPVKTLSTKSQSIHNAVL